MDSTSNHMFLNETSSADIDNKQMLPALTGGLAGVTKLVLQTEQRVKPVDLTVVV